MSTTPQNESETIAVAMSGGVDSSAVAALLRAQGHTLVGLTLQLWNQRRLAGHEGMPEAVQGRCCSIDDVYDARHVAEQLDIPYYVVNQQDRFEAEVVKPFVSEYLAGRTPIPCTLCNNHLKFDQLLITARQIGADRIATGHYARNHYDESRGRWILSRPADHSKDQTYFLFGLTQDQLSRTLFPLGEMHKPAVREMAAEAGLDVATKSDSQEICFIPGGDYNTFLQGLPRRAERRAPRHLRRTRHHHRRSHRPPRRHPELHRRPAQGPRPHLSPTRSTSSPSTPTPTRSPSAPTKISSPAISSPTASTGSPSPASPKAKPSASAAKIRHRHTPAMATLSRVDDDTVHALFDEPQRAITPGQSAVFYQEDEVVGGGWIM